MSLERVCVCTVYGKRDPLPPLPPYDALREKKRKEEEKGVLLCKEPTLPFVSPSKFTDGHSRHNAHSPPHA